MVGRFVRFSRLVVIVSPYQSYIVSEAPTSCVKDKDKCAFFVGETHVACVTS